MSLGGGGGGQPSTTVTTQELSPEQKRLLDLVIPEAEKIIKSPPTLFPGSTIAPLDPLQAQAQQQTLDLVGAGSPIDQLINATVGGTGFLTGGSVLFPESNPALRAAVEGAVRPLTESFENVILPGIRQGAITAGGFGGSRQGIAEGLASQGLLRQIGDTTAKLESEAFQTSLDAMVKALFAAPQTAQLPFVQPGAVEAVGTQRQLRAQAQLSEEAQRFLSEQLIPFATAQDVAALAFGFPGGKVTSTTQFPGGGGGGGFLGAALPLAFAIGAPFLGVPSGIGGASGAALAALLG